MANHSTIKKREFQQSLFSLILNFPKALPDERELLESLMIFFKTYGSIGGLLRIFVLKNAAKENVGENTNRRERRWC